MNVSIFGLGYVGCLTATSLIKEAHKVIRLERVIDSAPIEGHPCIGLNGLSLKSGTNSLRDSPFVLIAGHLVAQGCDLKIYDSAVENSIRDGIDWEYIERHIPCLADRLVHSLDDLILESDILLLTRDEDDLVERLLVVGKRPRIIDLRQQNGLTEQNQRVPERGNASCDQDLARPVSGWLDRLVALRVGNDSEVPGMTRIIW